MESNMEPWYIIVNPRAGSGKTIGVWNHAKMMLDDAGVVYESVFTKSPGDAKSIAYSASSNGFRHFIAVGGDGTLHEILQGIVEYSDAASVSSDEFCISCIPIGSGNDWVKTVGFTGGLSDIVSSIARSETHTQDVVTVHTPDGDSVMLNVGGTGFDSMVCERVNTLKAQGHRSRFIYVGALLKTIIGLKSMNVHVEVDGNRVFSGECYSIALGNGKYSGGGMLQTAGALIDDGLVDIMLVPKLPLRQLIKEAHTIFDGTILLSKRLKTFRGKNIAIIPYDDSHMVPVEADGEIIGHLPMEVHVRTTQIRYVK